VVEIDGAIYAKMTTDRLVKKLNELRSQAEALSALEERALFAPASG
jgi:hypothetical protein